jgi:protein-tyrosine phosphatase
VFSGVQFGHALIFAEAKDALTLPCHASWTLHPRRPLVASLIARLQALVAQGVVPTTDETVDLMRETYRDFVNHNAGTFGWFMKHLLEQPTPQVFHCTAGKDRTGFAAALLLSALGADRETIEHDYLLTNQLYRRDPRMEGNGHPHVMKVLWQVQPEFCMQPLRPWTSSTAACPSTCTVRLASARKSWRPCRRIYWLNPRPLPAI